MFSSETYRVLIASPSDLVEERKAATEAINEWNAQHAVAESVVLLPVKWETHSRPQVGLRAQETINRQLVQQTDILVGIFWTRIGSSTGVAESGTVEEIEQFAASGKPALLYFSNRPIDPNKIHLNQHRRLKSFKTATYKKALTGAFSGIDELRHTLLRDLTSQVRDIIGRRVHRNGNVSQAFEILKLWLELQRHKITLEDYRELRELVLEPRLGLGSWTKDPAGLERMNFSRGETLITGHRTRKPKQRT